MSGFLDRSAPAMRETWVWSLGWEDPLEKGKAIHSSILAWKIPWTLQWMGSQGVGHDWVTFIFTFFQETCSWRSQSSKQNAEGQEIKWFDFRWADIHLFVEAVLKKQYLPGTWINSNSQPGPGVAGWAWLEVQVSSDRIQFTRGSPDAALQAAFCQN